MPRPLLAFALAALSFAVTAPTQFAVGHHDVAWPNLSGQGTPLLAARVCYPSTTGGSSAPIEPNPIGWPVIVFLHGYSLIGSDYGELGAAFAAKGFAVVMLDTAQWNYVDQAYDGIAAFAALSVANRDTGTFFAGAFDTRRIAIAGHSMGAGTMGLVLASNPGYRCGYALAPVSPGVGPAAQIQVPFGMMVGTGDSITPWAVFSQPYYQAVAPTTGLKFWWLMDNTCDHMNIVGFSGATDPAFTRAMDVGIGFFRHFLDIDPAGLERCLGPAAFASPRLVKLTHQVVQPRVWAASRLAIGRTVRFSMTSEVGPAGILAAQSTSGETQTSLGILLLDPASTFTWTSGFTVREGRLDVWLTVPNNVSLVGYKVALQALGNTPSNQIQLGSAAEFIVGS